MLRSIAIRIAATAAFCLLALASSAAAPQPTSRWIILSDIHFNPFDSAPAGSTSTADTNLAMLDTTIAYMKQRQPDASVIVIAGNFLEHRFTQRIHAGYPHLDATVVAENAMRTIAQRFDAAFPRAQFLIALGDDDDPCGDDQATANSPYLRAIAKIWEPLINRGGAAPDFLQTFSTGGYYTARIGSSGHLRAVVANTTYWVSTYKDTCARRPEHPGADELNWFESTLGSTAPDDYNLVLLHLPPGVAAFANALQPGVGALTYLSTASNQALMQILADPKYHVNLVITGHVERTEFRWINGVPILIVPSIARPVRGIPMFFIADVNPSSTIAQNSPTLINDFAAFIYGDSGQWGGAYDYADAFNEDAFDATAIQDIHKRLYQNWRPPTATRFTVDATTYCAQDELGDYLSCINHS